MKLYRLEIIEYSEESKKVEGRIAAMNKSEQSQAMLKAAQETADTMEWEATQRQPKEQALLKMLSKSTSGQRPKGSSSSGGAGRAQPKGRTTGTKNAKGSQGYWLMEKLKANLPHLTEEEIREAAGGLLG